MPPERRHAHLPWSRRGEDLELLLALGLAPEIAFKGPDLDGLASEQLEALAGRLAATGQRPTVHAPFFDLSPGAMEPLVRTVTVRRLSQALQAAARLGAHLMVVHPGYDRWRYPNLAGIWTEYAAESFARLLDEAVRYDCRLALENIYEETPATLTALVERLASPWFGHCFDIGHWHLFGRMSQTDWLATIAPRLFHLHLHDNHGQSDAHLPVGEGSIDFHPLLQLLVSLPEPPSLTFEAHTPAELQRSLAGFTHLKSKE
jgi:sugar phosphate isomerase/epimerase